MHRYFDKSRGNVILLRATYVPSRMSHVLSHKIVIAIMRAFFSNIYNARATGE